MDGHDPLAARLARIVHESNDLVGVIDRDLRCVFVNEAVARAAGISAAELQGKGHLELGLPGELAATLRSICETVFENGDESRLTVELPSANGCRHLECRVVPLPEADGRVEVVVGYGRDVTEERTREALAKKLEETQRLESLGLLAGGIAHDFNNLLTSILGTATVARRAKDPGEIDHALAQIETSCMQAADLCRQMLAYAGREQAAHEPLDLCELLGQTRELLAPSVSKDLCFSFDLPGDLPTIDGDRAQVQQVLMNLLLNAAEATKGHGEITVRARLVDGRAIDWTGAQARPERADGELVTLAVRDRGHGMDRATLGRIFEPFFTTKFTGRGLGLAATLGILKSHGAGLIVESAPGEGTTFHLYFRPDGEPSRPASSLPRQGAGPLRVLVVDDEKAVLQATTNMLAMLGHDVSARGSAADALATIEEASTPFDLVVLDLTMPKMDGAEALGRIRAMHPALPVILMSGYSEADVADQLTQPATAFLHKPFRFGDLERALADALDSVGE